MTPLVALQNGEPIISIATLNLFPAFVDFKRVCSLMFRGTDRGVETNGGDFSFFFFLE